ncbi:putative gp23 [Burkholderia thailandensis USAMRU Malaysia |nr:putative gp57 [Burkholderia thailandensis 2002721723]AHI79621.1 putative gp23 [Burkholderia thailandensis E444]AIC86941.1 putative gp23 [Burkholderia thailandensis USAMRU Malaysia \
MRTTNARPLSRMLLLLALPLAACSSASTSSSQPPTIPPLPPEARQPATPSICLPTCSAALTSARANWQSTLTEPASPASSANATTTR